MFFPHGEGEKKTQKASIGFVNLPPVDFSHFKRRQAGAAALRGGWAGRAHAKQGSTKSSGGDIFFGSICENLEMDDLI